jgi:hypothetical protein
MIDRAAVRELAVAEGLRDHADLVLAAVRPGWNLEPDPMLDVSTLGIAKIGGDPDLMPSERWPLNRRGVAMTFLAQVDCATLPSPPQEWPDPGPWSHGGQFIRLFADLLDSPHEPCAACALAAPLDAEIARVAAPPIPDPWPPGGPSDYAEPEERYHRLAEAAIRPRPFLTVPEALPGVKEHFDDFSALAQRYTDFSFRLRIDGRPLQPGTSPGPLEIHHLLGESCSLQGDVRTMATLVGTDPDAAAQWNIAPDSALADEDAWSILLGLHWDDRIGLQIEDAGALHILVPAADLTAGRLDRLMCDVSSC